MKTSVNVCLFSIVLLASVATTARADEVTDWNRIMLDSIRTNGVTGLIPTRFAAIVQVAVYDAVNGIERRYTPIHVPPAAAPGASRRAAVVQAAYASLAALYPAQQADLKIKRDASLAAIASDAALEHSQSIARGIEWGQKVAEEVVAWRSTDGFFSPPPPYFGVNAPGQWRSVVPFAALQFATMTTWVIDSPTQFPLPGPPALTSAQYTADFNEVKSLGSAVSSTRTADQTLLARFWQSASSPDYFWDGVATALADERHLTLSETARLLALVNVATADAGIAVWNAKYRYNFWRPVTAINLADTDGNPATTADPSWTSLIPLPPYPDYPSGLISVSAAPIAVLADYFGENTPFIVATDSAVPDLAGVTRYFPDFDSALDELVLARILGGIHFRTADEDARQFGTTIGNYIVEHAALRLKGKH